MRYRWLVLALAALSIGLSSAWAQSLEARETLWGDPRAITGAIARGDSDPLLVGLLAAYELRDADAIKALKAVVATPSADIAAARTARTTLAMALLRSGAYRESADQLSTILADTTLAAEDRESLQQTFAVASLLRTTPAQRRVGFAPGEIAMTRDRAGLERGQVRINGQDRTVVFDTGANFSVLMRSEASALGVEILGDTAGIGSVTQTSTPAKIGLARTVTVGDVRFENVVFLVMPDANLSFAGGAYTIPGILGFPVLSQLERLQFAKKADGGETLSWGPSAAGASQRDLFVDGLTPLVYARVEDGPLVKFAFDTGANKTSIRPSVLAAQPALAGAAVEASSRVGSAGGETTVTSLRIPSLRLRIDDRVAALSNVSVHDEADETDDNQGRLGQDALAGGYIMDFPAGDFALRPAP